MPLQVITVPAGAASIQFSPPILPGQDEVRARVLSIAYSSTGGQATGVVISIRRGGVAAVRLELLSAAGPIDNATWACPLWVPVEPATPWEVDLQIAGSAGGGFLVIDWHTDRLVGS